MLHKILKTLIVTYLGTQMSSLLASELDIEAIRKMQGCYRVNFNFQEKKSYHPDYQTKTEVYNEDALELIVLEENEENNTYRLQHILQIGANSYIKHWHQDWQYAAENMLNYRGQNEWTWLASRPESWTQTVYQVDGSPRYAGFGHFIHGREDNYSSWISTAPAPLPRRELKRNDYQFMLRKNIVKIWDHKWWHEQENEKWVQKEESNIQYPLAKEEGLNSYQKVDESNCEGARQWWNTQAPVWNLIHRAWQQSLQDKRIIKIAKKEGQKLWRELLPWQLNTLDKN